MFSGDVVIKMAIQMGLDDMRQNPWLIDDMMGQFSSNPNMAKIYGKKEIERCKEWFLNNKIDVYLRYRNDKDQMPCVTVALGSSSPDNVEFLADQTNETQILMPAEIGKTIGFIIKPFIPAGYDPDEGLVSVPSTVKMQLVQPGMILVNPDTGDGYVILDKTNDGIIIEQGLEISASKLAVVPKTQTFKARRESRFYLEQYSIGTHVHGDPAALLWLNDIVWYILHRYNEVLLEGQCFQNVSFSRTDLTPNNMYGVPNGENVFSRYINMSGQAEHSWIKTPKRTIEAIDIIDRQGDLELAGIKIISNLDSPQSLGESEDELWTTVDDEG